VAHIELVSLRLLLSPEGLAFQLVGAFLTHLAPVKALSLLFLDSKASIEMKLLLLLSLDGEVQDRECVMHQVKLDLPIEGAVGPERSQGVYLKNIGL